MDDGSPLEVDIRRRIAAAGPMPVGEFMTLCLTDRAHGYYTTRDPLGERGDFITSPEISQMFGELIGLWMAAVWKQMGAPGNVRVIELGPGRGTMMNDALRAAKVLPAFREAAVLHLVEISPALQAVQQKTLEQLPVPMFWHGALKDVPRGPAIIVANEFFDALPVNQAVKKERGWYERLVEIDAVGNLAFTLAPEPIAHFERLLPPAARAAPLDAIFEWRTDTVAMEMGRRLADDGGAALVIDYGHADKRARRNLAGGRPPRLCRSADRARQHRPHRACRFPGAGARGGGDGRRELRAHRAVGLPATPRHRDAGGRAQGQGAPAAAADIDTALARLIGHGRTGMGTLFKAAAYAHPKLGTPPGFA